LKFRWVTQKVNQLFHFIFRFIDTGYISKRHFYLIFTEQTGSRASKRHRTATSAALHLPHKENPYSNE
jgi:hypothetical protein